MIQSERRGPQSKLVCGGGEDGMTDCGRKGVSIIHSLSLCFIYDLTGERLNIGNMGRGTCMIDL